MYLAGASGSAQASGNADLFGDPLEGARNQARNLSREFTNLGNKSITPEQIHFSEMRNELQLLESQLVESKDFVAKHPESTITDGYDHAKAISFLEEKLPQLKQSLSSEKAIKALKELDAIKAKPENAFNHMLYKMGAEKVDPKLAPEAFSPAEWAKMNSAIEGINANAAGSRTYSRAALEASAVMNNRAFYLKVGGVAIGAIGPAIGIWDITKDYLDGSSAPNPAASGTAK